MKKIISILIFLTPFLMSAQKNSLPESFFSCWAASYEEDTPNSMTKNFRLCDYPDFPPSRFRQQLSFDKDGTCKVLNLGATDAHFYTENKWTYDRKKKTVSISDEKGKVFMRFRINSVLKDRMNVTHLEIK